METVAVKAISERRADYQRLREPPISTLCAWTNPIRSFFQNLSIVSYRTLNESTVVLSEIKDSPKFQKYPFSMSTSYEVRSTNGVLGLLHENHFQIPISACNYYAYLDLKSPIFTFSDRSKIRYLHINFVNHRLTIIDFEWLVYYHDVIEDDTELRLPTEDMYTQQFTKELLQEISKILQEKYTCDESFAIID